MEVVQSLLYTDGSFADVGVNLGILLLFMQLPVFLLPRLKNTLITHRYEAFE
jgi:hypothetical protein